MIGCDTENELQNMFSDAAFTVVVVVSFSASNQRIHFSFYAVFIIMNNIFLDPVL